MTLISVKDAAKEYGVRSERMHAICRKGGIQKAKKGGRTYIDDADLKEYFAKHPLKKRRVKVVDGEDVPSTSAGSTFATMEQRPEFMLWNKGQWRGWAVAAVEDVDHVICAGITDYGKKFMWVPSKVAEEVAAGTMFLLDPAQTVHFIAMQLLRVKEKEGMPEAIRSLEQAAKDLEAIKERENAN